MVLKFAKYHGNGNDFVMVNNLNDYVNLSTEEIAGICNRHMGIGADGLIIIDKSDKADFKMLYYNSDGNLASMCGNGGRCAAAFAYVNSLCEKEMEFEAYDGIHKASVLSVMDENTDFVISLHMSDVTNVEENEKYMFMDTGSPHYIEFVEHLAEFDVVNLGRKTRYSEKFHPGGTNVNFVELNENRVFVRTYERGVEDETLSCGTGVTATAIATYLQTGKKDIDIHTIGGDFNVKLEKVNNTYTNIILTGPVKLVFKGEY
ncbi:MAG: diaminopimelate epimerase [Marinilabiliales bacterium]|nr:MAG: diaminopimelate epimerase [Marinilabiliales bacterium]